MLFLCTANLLDTIPPPLLDRMDVIHLSGYTEEEKFWIARRYLVPKQLEAHGLAKSRASIATQRSESVIREYTREAGRAQPRAPAGRACRKAAREIAEGRAKRITIGEKRVREWLGPRRFAGEVRKRTSEPGVATGLAVTPVGGDVLFIEATAYPGKGRLKVTGQLGDVMQESAQAAHSWAWAHAAQLDLDPAWFAAHDVHVHVPAGAQPKDGPSAGITIATAIVSIAAGRPVSADVAMTGEITLTGQVLQIGGVREKVLAAQRAGVKTVVLPRENEPDLAELPDEARERAHLRARGRRRGGPRGRLRRLAARPAAARVAAPRAQGCARRVGSSDRLSARNARVAAGKTRRKDGPRQWPRHATESPTPPRTFGPTSSARSRTRRCARTSRAPSPPRGTSTTS